MHIVFFAPEFLFAMLAVIVWIGGIVYEKRLAIYLQTQSHGQGATRNNRILRGILGSLCIMLVTIGMSDPRSIESHANNSKNGIDIALVLDISKSMLAEDIHPNRMEAAKQSIVRFIEARKNDRISLSIFAGKPFLLSPLSFDTAALVSIVQSIWVDTIRQEIPGFSGTAIWDGLILAAESLQNDPSREKIIILLTDGEANMGIDPKASAIYAKEKRASIYTIGLWDPQGTELYTTTPSGVRDYFIDEKTGKPLIATIDEKLLTFIAESTGWSYANATNSTALSKIFEKLSTLRVRPLIEGAPEITSVPLAQYAFLLAIACLAWLLYLERRRIDSWLWSAC